MSVCLIIQIIFSGTLRDKKMKDKLKYITNDNKQNYLLCKLKLLVKNKNVWTLLVFTNFGYLNNLQ